jgi:hypothetical protein
MMAQAYRKRNKFWSKSQILDTKKGKTHNLQQKIRSKEF